MAPLPRLMIGPAGLAALAACVAAGPAPPAFSASPEQVDRGCQIAATDKLKAALGVDGEATRALPPPAGSRRSGFGQDREVEVDAGMRVTYVFACVFTDSGTFVAPVGHR
jgi:hypothetical protein